MDFLKNLSKRERALLIAASSCVFLAVVYRVVLIQVWDKNAQMDEQITEMSNQLAVFHTFAARKNRVEADYGRLEQTFEAPGTDKERVRVFQQNLEKISSETGVRISKMVPRKVKEGGWGKTYLVDLEIEASTKQIVTFLYKMNQADAVYRTDAFHLYRKGKGPAGKDLGASLTVSMLVVDPPSAAPADS